MENSISSLITLVKENGIENGVKEMKNKGCIFKYGFKPPLNACHYTEDCSYCWKEALEDIRFRYIER